MHGHVYGACAAPSAPASGGHVLWVWLNIDLPGLPEGRPGGHRVSILLGGTLQHCQSEDNFIRFQLGLTRRVRRCGITSLAPGSLTSNGSLGCLVPGPMFWGLGDKPTTCGLSLTLGPAYLTSPVGFCYLFFLIEILPTANN